MARLSGVAAAAQEAIAEIRVHGNHTTPDADVIALARLNVGDPASDTSLREAEQRLHDSGRFDAVEVRRRYRSIANPSDVLVILLVDERAAVAPGNLTPGPLARLRAAGMWLPILNARDGYGLTYGARVGVVDALGENSRVSVPMTWGGERRVGLEMERAFERGPLTTARGSVSLSRTVNPHFDAADTRRQVILQADRALTGWLRAGADARIASVSFADERRRHTGIGGHLIVDTRLDPSFPRNALHTIVSWERRGFAGRNAGVWNSDVRGYIGIGGSAVLALRAQHSRASAALPSSEQRLVGGAESLRGYRAGHRAGDNMAALSAEARLPLTSPLNYGRFGVKAFVDTAAAWNEGARVRDQPFDRGVGGGMYFGATAVTGNVDVAWPREGKPRVHIGLGISF